MSLGLLNMSRWSNIIVNKGYSMASDFKMAIRKITLFHCSIIHLHVLAHCTHFLHIIEPAVFSMAWALYGQVPKTFFPCYYQTLLFCPLGLKQITVDSFLLILINQWSIWCVVFILWPRFPSLLGEHTTTSIFNCFKILFTVATLTWDSWAIILCDMFGMLG